MTLRKLGLLLSTQPHPVGPHLFLHLQSQDHTPSLSVQSLIPGQGYGAFGGCSLWKELQPLVIKVCNLN